MQSDNPTAAILLIGDEILSGRTRDLNAHHLAGVLNAIGIDLREIRVVADDHAAIVAALRALDRHLGGAWDMVFSSGGIGPTHDDITESRKLQKEISATTAFLQSVIDNIPTCVAVRNASDNSYRLVNRAFETFIGASRESIIGSKPSDIYANEALTAKASGRRTAASIVVKMRI